VVFYQLARNLVHTEVLISELIKRIPYRVATYLDINYDEKEFKDRDNLENLTAHRMYLLKEMAAGLGYKLVKYDERG